MITLKDIENTKWGNIVKNNIKAYGKSIPKRKALVEKIAEGNDIKRKFAYLLLQSLKIHAKGFNMSCCCMDTLDQYIKNVFDTAGHQFYPLINDFEWTSFVIGRDVRMEFEAVDIHYTMQEILDALSDMNYWKRVLEATGFDSDEATVSLAKKSFEKSLDMMFNDYFGKLCRKSA